MIHVVLAMKPLSGSFVENAVEYSVAGINIDGCRIGTTEIITNHSRSSESAISKGKFGNSKVQDTHRTKGQMLGRFPANIILDAQSAKLMDNESRYFKVIE